jgi:hypothetical protein
VQLNLFEIPLSLPSNWSNPGYDFPTTLTTPEFYVYDNFSKIIGMNPGSYFESRLSDFTPEVSPISSILVTCSLINNHFTNPSTIISSFVASGKYGSILNIENQNLIFSNIRDGEYHEFDVSFIDQNYQPVHIIDTNIIIYLVIKIIE